MKKDDSVYRILITCLAVCVAFIHLSVVPSAAQADPTAELLSRINAARVANGLPPYALNDKLAATAQAHSQDMASKSKVDRVGSDGSTPKSRILAAGYGQWTIGPVIDEAIYGGTGGAQEAFDWWMSTDTDKGRLLSTRFREVGIGAATASNGWTYWTLDLGAQPNVLPAYVNGGVTSVATQAVTLTLTTENAVPAGEGTGTIGQPLQVRLASDDSFTGAEWQPWAAQVPFKLQATAQQKIYVLYRDAQGRTASYFIVVTLTNVPPPTVTPSPTWTPPPSITPLPTATPKPTETSAPTRTPIPTVGNEEATTPTPPPLTPLIQPTTSVTPPTPTPRGTPKLRVTPTTAAAGSYGSPPSGLVMSVCALQVMALVLAAFAILRRSLHRMPALPAAPQRPVEASPSESKPGQV
jgi:uncharacterized protein YkwD